MIPIIFWQNTLDIRLRILCLSFAPRWRWGVFIRKETRFHMTNLFQGEAIDNMNLTVPIESMYGNVWYIYTYIWLIFMVNSIHGVVWGIWSQGKSSQLFETCWPVVPCRIRKRNSHRIPWIPGLPAHPVTWVYRSTGNSPASIFVLKSYAQWLRILL